MDDLVNTSGRVLGGLLSANEIYHGGLMRYLTNRQALLQDPSLRGSLGPFGAGLLQVGGQSVPTSATEEQRAGVSPEQASQLGVGIVGPSPTFGGASPAGSRFIPNLPPLSPEAQVQQGVARSVLDLLRQPGMAEQAGRHAMGLQPPGLTPQQIAASRETLGPGETLQVPMAGGAKETLRGRFGTGGTAPFGYIRDDVTGRLVRDPRIAGAKAGGGGDAAINTEFKLWRASHPQGTYDDYIKDKARGSELTKMSGPATVQIEQELQQVRTLDELTKDMLSALDKPEVKSQLGVLSGRIGFAKYKAGLAQNPLENEFITLRELVRVLAVGRLARAAGSRSAVIWQDLNIHPPQAGDQPQLIRDKLIQLRRALHDTASNAATVARTPRSRLGTLVPDADVPGQPGAGTNPMQTTPGGNSYRVLGE